MSSAVERSEFKVSSSQESAGSASTASAIAAGSERAVHQPRGDADLFVQFGSDARDVAGGGVADSLAKPSWD